MLNYLCETENLAFFARYDFLDLCLLGETGTGKTHLARLIHELIRFSIRNYAIITR